ncbi:hypothetical protein HD554DRAFT_1996125, partial [Boletus coccyginus]
DGHFRHIIYGLGPYIADYPEQAMLACIIQGWCAWYVILVGTFPAVSQLTTASCTAQNTTMGLQVLWDNYGIVGDI